MFKEIAHRKTQTRAGDARLISELNKVKVINLVRDNDGVSRADLAKRSGLSAPTISRIIDGLIHEGLVTEIGAGVSHGGRKPTLLRFSGIDSFIIGIDLGTTNIYGVLTDLEANVIAEVRAPTQVEGGFDRLTFHVFERHQSRPGQDPRWPLPRARRADAGQARLPPVRRRRRNLEKLYLEREREPGKWCLSAAGCRKMHSICDGVDDPAHFRNQSISN